MLCRGCQRPYHLVCSGLPEPAHPSRFRCPVCVVAAADQRRGGPLPPPEPGTPGAALAEQGFCALPGCLADAAADGRLARLRDEAAGFLERALRAHAARRPVPDQAVVKRRRRRSPVPEYRNLKQRRPGRFDLTPPAFEAPFDPVADPDGRRWSWEWLGGAPEDGREAPWMPTVRAALGPDCRPMARGVMLARAGAGAQDWHTDGPCLCEEPTAPDLPPHAVNVFIPLVPVGEANGTGLRPGTHRRAGADAAAAVVPPLAIGDALVFDYRLVHRGEPNRTDQDRAVVYLSYAVPWFTDAANFSERQYGVRLEVPPP